MAGRNVHFPTAVFTSSANRRDDALRISTLVAVPVSVTTNRTATYPVFPDLYSRLGYLGMLPSNRIGPVSVAGLHIGNSARFAFFPALSES